MFPELRDTVPWHQYKNREDTEQEEEEVTRKHKWEKSIQKPSTAISMWKENSDFQLLNSKLLLIAGEVLSFLGQAACDLLYAFSWQMASSCLLCVLCSAGWDVHAALCKLTRMEYFGNEQDIKDYGSLQLEVNLASCSDFE